MYTHTSSAYTENRGKQRRREPRHEVCSAKTLCFIYQVYDPHALLGDLTVNSPAPGASVD